MQFPAEPLHRSSIGRRIFDGRRRRKTFNLDQIAAGNMDPLIAALLELDKQQRLEML